MLIEHAFNWILPLMWRMDAMYEARGPENGLKRKPSEYVKDLIWFTTQPLDYPEDKLELTKALEWMEADKILLFFFDYPHWTYDDPQWVTKHIPGLHASRRSCSATASTSSTCPPPSPPCPGRSGPSEVQAVVDRTGPGRAGRRPEPVAGYGEVLIEVRAVGICGTDLHAPLKPAIFTGVILGHEFAGTLPDGQPVAFPDSKGQPDRWPPPDRVIGRHLDQDDAVTVGVLDPHLDQPPRLGFRAAADRGLRRRPAGCTRPGRPALAARS